MHFKVNLKLNKLKKKLLIQYLLLNLEDNLVKNDCLVLNVSWVNKGAPVGFCIWQSIWARSLVWPEWNVDLDAEPRGNALFDIWVIPLLGRDGCPDLFDNVVLK